MKVEWRKVPSFPHMEVSSSGDVRSIDRFIKTKEGFLRKIKGALYTKNIAIGYYYVSFRIKGKSHNKKVARLLMEAFFGESGLVVNHKDSNKLNDNINNLEYCTQKQNVRHAHENGRVIHNKIRGWNKNTKIQTSDFEQIFELRSRGYSQLEIGEMFRVHPSLISRVLNNKTKFAAKQRKRREEKNAIKSK